MMILFFFFFFSLLAFFFLLGGMISSVGQENGHLATLKTWFHWNTIPKMRPFKMPIWTAPPQALCHFLHFHHFGFYFRWNEA